MPLNLDAVGTVGDPVERSWTSKDALLYAVGVGAGAVDVTEELAFTTENSRGVDQQVLPTFGVVLGMGAGSAMRNIGKFNPAMLVHAESGIALHQPLKPEGKVVITSKLTGIHDKGSGALVTSEANAVDPDTGEAVFTTTGGVFIRGEGGFATQDPGGDGVNPPMPSPPEPYVIPARKPDHEVIYATLPHQALIYRLSGDRNPLHSDPKFAGMAGFDRPILHGLCTYGFTGRALLHTLCESDPARLTSMYGRFSKPVMPGQSLTVSMWIDESGTAASFRTTTEDDTIVIDRGRVSFT